MSRSKKEILTYRAPWTVYSMSWCRGKEDYCSHFFRMAIGSFKEEYSNQVQVIQLFEEPVSSEGGDRENVTEPLYSFQPICQFDHPYPTTKVSLFFYFDPTFSSLALLGSFECDRWCIHGLPCNSG